MSNKLQFKVVFASTSDSGHSERELEVRNDASSNTNKSSKSHGRGWQSERFCDYPQYLILHLNDMCEIKQIQILSHQSKIASKIEIWVGSDSRYTWKHAIKTIESHSSNKKQYWKQINWKRLGYLSLDKNERSNWKARELKSVYIDTKANFVKFALHESHINTINLFNQVGVVALNILGKPLGINNINNINNISDNIDTNDMINNETNNHQTNNQNNQNNENINQSHKNDKNDNSSMNHPENIIFDMEYDEETAKKLRELIKQKQNSVDNEDYDEAKRCKIAIDNLKNAATELVRLEKEKKLAVEQEDYDSAKSFKLQIQRLRQLSLNGTSNINPNQNQNQNPNAIQQTQQMPMMMQQQPPNNMNHMNNVTNGYYQQNTLPHQQQQQMMTNNMGYPIPPAYSQPFNQQQQPQIPMQPQYEQQQPSQHSQNFGRMRHPSNQQLPPPSIHQPPPQQPNGASRQLSHQSIHSMHSIHSNHNNVNNTNQRSLPQSNDPSQPDSPKIMNGVNGMNGMNGMKRNPDERAIRPLGNIEFGTMDINNPNPFGARGGGGGGGKHINPYEEQPILPQTEDPYEKTKNAGIDDIPPSALARKSSNLNNNNLNNITNKSKRGDPNRPIQSIGMNNNNGMSNNHPSQDNSNNNDPPPLKASVRKDCENLIEMFDEYTIQCLYSNNWNHRNKGLKKIQDYLNPSKNTEFVHPDNKEVFKSICKILLKSFNDKVAHVFLTGVDLFNLLLETYHSKIKIEDINKYSHTLLLSLINTLGHSNTRMVDASGSMLITLAHHHNLLSRSVYLELIKPMKKNLPKHLKGRGVVLLELIPQFQIPKGVQISQLMKLIKPQLIDKNGDIRDIGVQLTTMLYQIVGNQIISYLDDLNDFTKESLNNAFMEATGQQNVIERAPKSNAEQQRPSKTMSNNNNTRNTRQSTKKSRNTRSINKRNSPSKRNSNINKRNTNTNKNTSKQQSPQQQKLKKNKARSPIKRNNNNTQQSPQYNNSNNNQDELDEEPEDVCNFCGLRDSSFAINEENLDLHYWQSCPMLTSCKLCEQVIEIPTLHEHILSECEAAEKHQKCSICQIPYPISQIKQHMAENKCKPSLPLDKANRCTLCIIDIPPYDDGWRKHLLTYPGCPKNERPLPNKR